MAGAEARRANPHGTVVVAAVVAAVEVRHVEVAEVAERTGGVGVVVTNSRHQAVV